jgi:hypothetical protein
MGHESAGWAGVPEGGVLSGNLLGVGMVGGDTVGCDMGRARSARSPP